MISDVNFNAKVGEWGPGLRFKSRIFRICLYLRKDTSRGVYVPLRAHFLVSKIANFTHHLSQEYDDVGWL